MSFNGSTEIVFKEEKKKFDLCPNLSLKTFIINGGSHIAFIYKNCLAVNGH